MIVIPREGGEEMVRAIIERAAFVRLFVNSQAPRVDDSLDAFAEPEGGGYEPKRLQPADWSVSGFEAEHQDVEWILNAPVGEIFGWFITTETGVVLFAELFDESMGFTRFGGRARVAPFLSLRRAK